MSFAKSFGSHSGLRKMEMIFKSAAEPVVISRREWETAKDVIRNSAPDRLSNRVACVAERFGTEVGLQGAMGAEWSAVGRIRLEER